MKKTLQKSELPGVVETFQMPNCAAMIIKVSSFSWIVVFKDYEKPHLTKWTWCISFEQASHIFDGCLDKLKEWKN